MQLKADDEQRCWFAGEARTEALWTQLWQAPPDQDDRDEERESGHRLQGSLQFLAALLLKLKMNMIIEVEIERRASYGTGRSNKENDFGFILPSARLFIVKPDGRVYTL